MMATFALVSVLGHVPNALLRPGKAPCRISVPGKAPCRISVPVALFEHHVVEHVVAQHHLVTRALPPLPTNGFEALLQYMATLAQHCRHGALPTVPTSTAAHLSLAYLSSLEHHYFRTTTAQAFSLVAAGDALAQAIEMRTGGVAYDPARTLRMGLLGLLIGGFGTARWLQVLERAVPGNGSPQPVIAKALLDACIWAPLANTAYLVLTPLTEGESPATVKRQLSEQFIPVMKTELASFLPYNLVSFSLVPPLVRPFTTGFISMCFAVYISWVSHSSTTSTTTSTTTRSIGGNSASPSEENMDEEALGGALPMIVEAEVC